ncbi:MAG: site-2 protease family protein [Gemmatimonadales bacterium]
MQEFLLALPVLLVSVVAHEYAHGYAALQQGDPTAAQLGRLTFNPVKHIDPWMTVLLPAMLWFGSGGQFVFGGAKPVPVNPRNYRNYRRGDIIVSSAGIVVNLGLFIGFVLLIAAVGSLGNLLPALRPLLASLQRMFYWGVWLNVLLAFFNLIPIPPLDGSHIFYHFLPPALGAKYRELSRYGFLVLLALMLFFQNLFFLLLAPAIMLTRVAVSIVGPFALQPPPF